MTDKNVLQLKDRSFSLYILIAMLVLVFFVVGIVAVNDYLNTKKIFEKNYQHLRRQTEQDIIVTLRLTDESYNLYDMSLNEQMQRGFDVVMEEYDRAAGIPSDMNLTDVKSTLGEGFDIYIINESGVIEFTTFEPDLGLDFKKIPYFFAYLTKIRNSEGFFPDRIVEGQTVGGRINKYAYMPTPDHRYVLELGLSVPSFSHNRASLRYKEAVDQIASNNPYIENVRIFNSMGKISYNLSEVVDDPTKITIQKVLEQRHDITIRVPADARTVKYLFIDMKNEQYGSDMSRIVEITYNDAMHDRAYAEHVQFHLLVALLALIVGVCAAYLLSRFLSKPIMGIVRDVDRISSGDLDLKISPTHVSEFQILEQSINTMVSSLKSSLKHIKDEEILHREMIDQLPIAVFMKNVSDGKYSLWNKASEQIFEIKASDAIGKSDRELFSKAWVSAIEEEDNIAIRDHIFVSNKKISNKSQGQRIIRTIIVPIFSSDNTLQYILGIGEDLTEETRNLKRELLFSITRRDILDQLLVIVSYLERAQLKATREEMQIFLDKTIESIESIRKQMVFGKSLQDLGDISPTWQPVQKLWYDAIRLLPVHKISISMEIKDIELYADTLLSRVFYNLMINSLQHGGHQLTKIRLYTRISGESVILVYEDDGVGIPLHKKEKIFEFGYGKGAGLGLFLIREILGNTGITITETGEPGKGARFEILIPKGKFRLIA